LGGLWDQLGGKQSAGEDIIIGIVDSGVWPESKSFTDRDAAGKLIYQQIPGWHGKCTPGESFNASMCNQKLIGGQHFNAAWGGDAAINAQRPWEFNSVRDYNGHGTHTSSTAGGNNGVQATGPAARSARSAAWRRAPASQPTRHCGRRRTVPRPAVSPPTSLRRSTRPSPTAWT
jgi:subtilisin family serine protease